MARLYSVNTGVITLSASATKSVWLLDPVADGFVITEFALSGNDSALSVPVQIALYIVTSLGTPAGTTGVVQGIGTAITADTTALTALTTEPTTKVNLASWYAQPLGVMVDKQFPLGREIVGLGAGDHIGLQVVTPAGVTPSVVGHVWFEE